MKSNSYKVFYYGDRFIIKTNISCRGFHQDNHMLSLFDKQVPKVLHEFVKCVQLTFVMSYHSWELLEYNHTPGQLLSIYMIGGVLKFRVLFHN